MMIKKVSKSYFPDARVKNGAIVVDSFRSVCVYDRKVHDAILELFSVVATPTGSVENKISCLAQIALHQPRVVLRLFICPC